MRTILLIVVLAAVAIQQTAALACTAFLAYDGKLALGGNSEDWKDPDTYLWFNPAEKGRYGRVAFGFGNLWPQGGMNDQGLFFDGMMTDPLPLEKTEGRQPCPDDVLDRMMRECANVDEAVKFLDRFHMPNLVNAMLFLGDRHGNSVIYEGDEVLRGDGRLQVVTNYYQSRQSAKEANCRRMLKAQEIFAEHFGNDDALTMDLARSVLDAVHQEGEYATKYSNIYDLTHGDIYLYCNHNFDAVVKLNLTKELAKGARTIALPSLFENEAAAVIAEYKPYLGRYVDTAEDRIVTVIEQHGNLSLDVPGQGVLELTPPDKQGRWHLAVAPQAAMSFERDDDGKVNIMKCHKGGFEFELLREGYTPPIEVDLKQAARYIGKYHSELRSVDFEVRIQNNRLAVYIPLQAIFELHPPGEDGKHRFRAMTMISVAFQESKEGHVVSMTLYKPGQEEKLPRLENPQGERGEGKEAGNVLRAQEAELPKAEQILDAYVQATGGRTAYASLRNRIEEITIESVGSGMTFSLTAFYARPDRSYFLIEGDAIGKIERGTSSGVAWESSLTTGPVIKKGAEKDRMLRIAFFDRITQWRKLFKKAECVGIKPIDGKPCYEVVMTPVTGEPETHYYDTKSHLITKAEATAQAVPFELFFSDHREVDGVLFPHEFRRVSMGQETRYTIDSIRHNVDIPDDRFKLPDEVQALLAGNAPDLRQLNLQSFEKVFRIVHDHYWDPEFGGLDWQAVGDELRPQIMKTSSLAEARAILSDMISRLKLSHFAIIPVDNRKEAEQPRNDGARGGETGIDARVIDGKALVTSVAEGSTAEQAGVRTGWEIIRINDFDVVANLKKLDRELPDTPSKRVKMAGGMVVRVRSGMGESMAVRFRNGDGALVDVIIPLGAPRGRSAKVGNFGHARVRIDVETVEDSIGYIAVSKFLDPAYVMKAFNDALESFMEADGIILDLRGNGGGKDAMALEMMRWFAPSEWVVGRLRTRASETEMTVRPRARTYDGPVAVLTDGLTGSSAEFVAAALQEMGRACIIGTRTKGEALPAEYTTLPNGDVFLYAVTDFVTGAGKRLEGIGVAPDIQVALTQESLLGGRDIVLEAAVHWMDRQDYTPQSVKELPKGKPSVDRLVVPKLTKDSVAKFLGFYRDEQNGREYEMVLHDGALAVRVPGMQDPLAFDPPDAEGYRALRLNPQSRIRFNEDEEGRVVSYTVYTPAGEIVRPRIEKDQKP